MSRATRRGLLGAAAGAALAGVATAAVARPEIAPPLANADTPLLALCAQFMELQAKIEAAEAACRAGTAPDIDGHLDGFIDGQLPLVNEMADLRATTLEGHQARARVLMKWYALDEDGGETESIVEWDRAWPLFRDLLGISV